jgi:hypothetical protein
VKFGWYFPNVHKPQSTRNIALISIIEGSETLQNVREATKSLFDFATCLESNGFFYDNRLIPVQCFFVGDLKGNLLVSKFLYLYYCALTRT